MLIQSKNLAGSRIISLHTGQAVGQTGNLIIDPGKLELAGFYVLTAHSRQTDMVLLPQDVRQVNSGGVYVDSVDEITPANELVRHQEVFEINYQLVGKLVRTAGKKKLGKVDDFVINTLTWQIQKIYVKQPVFKSFSGGTLVIDRSQIVEVTDKEITVTDATATKPALVTPPAT